jgi:hypothetical protein
MSLYFLASDASTLANFNTDIATLLTVLDAVTDAVIENVELKVSMTVPGGLKSTAGDQPMASGLLANYTIIAQPTKSYGTTTPALDRSWIDANGQPNDTGSLSTWTGYWLGSSGPGTFIPVFLSNLWEALKEPGYLQINTRKHRKQQQRVERKKTP